MRYFLARSALNFCYMLVAGVGAAIVGIILGAGVELFHHSEDIRSSIIAGGIAAFGYGALLAIIAGVLSDPIKRPDGPATVVTIMGTLLTLGVAVGDVIHNQLGTMDFLILLSLFIIPMGSTFAMGAFRVFALPRLFGTLPEKPVKP